MNLLPAGTFVPDEEKIMMTLISRRTTVFATLIASPAVAQTGTQAPESGAGLFWIIAGLVVFGIVAAYLIRRR